MKKASSPQRTPNLAKLRDSKKKKFNEPVQSSFSKRIEEDQESIDSNLSYYEVENLVDRREDVPGQREYLVKWKSYPDSQNTWEPVGHLKYIKSFVTEFDKQFDRRQAMKKAKTASSQPRVNKMIKKGKKSSKPPFQKPINQVFKALQPKDMKPMKPRQKSSLKEDFSAYIKKFQSEKIANESSDSFSQESVPVAILGFRRRPDFDMNVLVQMSKMPGQREPSKKMVLYSELRIYFPELIIDFMEQNLIFEEPGLPPKRGPIRAGEHIDHSDNVSDLTQNTQVS